jgi:hypothetical protein
VTDPLEVDERAKLLVELWKQTVEVQKHFNDICWRIRGLALTALTFALGAAALAVHQPVTVHLLWTHLQLSVIITVFGFVLWRAFYYVDRRWYHQLLKGSVGHGQDLEKAIQAYVPAAGLTLAISAASPYDGRSWRLKKTPIDSTKKLRRFYDVVSVLLILFAIGLQLGGSSGADKSTAKTPATRPTAALPTPSPTTSPSALPKLIPGSSRPP